jgi:hypothetical protein
MSEFRARLVRYLAMLGLWAGVLHAAAGSFVEHFAPPALSKGHTNRIALIGEELAGATGLWTSLPANQVSATLVEPSGDGLATFDVKVAIDAPVGLYGLRVATASGLSNVKLFLIDDLPVVNERESSPGTESPQRLSPPVAVLGKAREADIDKYSIDVAAGERLTFEIVGNRLGQDFDPVVTIKDGRGRQVVEHDNDIGLMFDCRFAHTFENSGNYTIEVRDTRFRGSDHLVYVLRIGRFPEGRVAFPSTVRAGDSVSVRVPGVDGLTQTIVIPSDAGPRTFFQALRRTADQASTWVRVQVSPYGNTLEQEPNDSPPLATPAPVPSVLHGAIASPGDRDEFAIDLEVSQRLIAQVECRALGSPADLDVTFVDPAGKIVNRVDTLPDGATSFEIQAKSKGKHLLRVRSLTGEGGPEYVYRVTLAAREPNVELISDASSLAIPRRSHQPLPLHLKRTDFGGPVALELRGAPPGISLKTDVVPEGELELDNVIAVAESVPEGVYSVQVVARIKTAGGERTAIATTLPLVDRLPAGRGPHGEPFELREDQRRLPPSLTDRIAILVTPPSLYTFELPDRSVTLPRYLETAFRLEITRAAGFDAPITFIARGGSLEPLNLQKPRIMAKIPPATRGQATVAGILRSGVNSELRKQRVTVTAHASDRGRSVDLTRTFELVTRVSYEPSAEPTRLEIEAGDSAKVAIHANRIAPFEGPITIRPSSDARWSLPPLVEIAKGADRAELKIDVPTGTKPGVYRIALPARARVSKFDETVTGKPVEVVVAAPKRRVL